VAVVSGYDWQPEQEDDREQARGWDRADDRERAEELERDREEHGEKGEITDRALDGTYLRETFGENRETRMPMVDGRPIVPVEDE
jgi:hypothetical protein